MKNIVVCAVIVIVTFFIGYYTAIIRECHGMLRFCDTWHEKIDEFRDNPECTYEYCAAFFDGVAWTMDEMEKELPSAGGLKEGIE